MTIVFEKKEFAYNLFPDIKSGDDKNLLQALEKFYTLGSVKPRVVIDENVISIKIDTISVELEQRKFQNLIALCEKGDFKAAFSLADKLTNTYPTISEYHRIKGQVLSELGNQEEAINSLIYALKWKPNNEWALLMMGNIFAKNKDDIDTAMKYYNQVLHYKPNDNITLNNIGANLMQLKKTDEALIYFNKALVSNPNYPNTHYALGLVADMNNNHETAFEKALDAIKVNNSKNQLFGNSLRLALDSAQNIHKNSEPFNILKPLISELEYVTKKKIIIQEDNTIATAAKVELAESYDIETHRIKYKKGYPAIEHLILHELLHIQFSHEAREKDSNQLFITNDNYKSQFIMSLRTFAKELNKKGVREEAISKYLTELFHGINRQVFNVPIDLFIEDKIFKEYKEFRPIQFLSLFNLISEGIQATTRKDIIENSPKSILSKSKIYNLINALHFKSLFKVDLVRDHKPTKLEYNKANELYKEFIEYRDDKEPAEEYELIQHWAEDLKLDKYFDLIDENIYRGNKSLEDQLEEIENDPFDIHKPDPSKERKMKKFLDSHSDKDINLAVTMYMSSAIEYFQKLSKVKVKEIAFEIATIGISGIDPNKDGYNIPSIKNSNFTGYQTLAYYYVSWAIGIPEMLNSLQMSFDKEYDLAHKFNIQE